MRAVEPIPALGLLVIALGWHPASLAAAEPSLTPAAPAVARVLVVYHSLTGNTRKMAEAVVQGAKRQPGVTVTLRNIGEVAPLELETADGLVLGCPTYFANVPGEMKAVMDDWNWKLGIDFTDKVGGAFSTGGGQVGGKEHVVMSLLMFMLSNRMIVVGPLYRNDATGSIWGEPGAAAMTGPLDVGVSPEELDAARRLGERVATVAARVRGERQRQ